MKVSSQSVTLIKFGGSDLDVVNAARVSFHKESLELNEKDIKLIGYLAKHNHFTPFAHNSLTFRIKAPIFVARQLVKHAVGGVWNEVSRRYVDEEPEFYLPALLHEKPTSAKQGAGDVHTKSEVILSGIKNMTWDSLSYYKWLINEGVAPEEARMMLPLNTMTEWWWTGSLMFFARVCKQRLDAHAQSATREVAKLINEQIPQEFQHSWKALMQ
jgi:thymidylate synthase (FAD)